MYLGEDKVIEFLSKTGKATLDQIASATSLHIDHIRRIVEVLKENGYLTVEQEQYTEIRPTKELQTYYSRGAPEFAVFEKALTALEKGLKLKVDQLEADEKQFGLKWAKMKGLITIEPGGIIPVKTRKDADELKNLFNIACNNIIAGKAINPELKNEFFRRNWIREISFKTLKVAYSGKPYSVQQDFDIAVASKDAEVGKSHPITKMTNRIKSIFAELGFEEMDGNIVESAFWNFDALFQPQDHPARDLADTFYVNGISDLPDKSLVKRVKKAHEEGWKYKWSEEEARKKVLRTHTTALSARYVAAINDDKPRKYFAVGRVFRNEATDYKHLAEFHQVDGIVIWKDATFRDLLGIMKEFYRKLGFEKIRFRPSFFPYTEPSLEVEIFYEPRKEWMEMGGAGIFRPEVSIPLANTYPVLAWGLSLERPLMLLLDLHDIRTLYKNDLEFLRNSRDVAISRTDLEFSRSSRIR